MVNWNGRRFLDALLTSLLATRYENYEVLVVDNGSTDDSRAVLEGYRARTDRLRILYLDRNYGFAGGNNAGLHHLSPDTEYVCFLNNDCTVEPGWLEPLVEFLVGHPEVGIVQPRLLRYNDPGRMDRAVVFVDRIGYDVYNLYLNLDDDHGPALPTEVFSVTGAAFVVRREVLQTIAFPDGLFDPDYFVYYEETDVCWRARLAGFQVWYCPASSVRHFRGGTTQRGSGLPALLVYHHTKNRISALLKNYDRANVCIWLPLLFLAELARVGSTVFRRKEHSLATLQGIAWVITHRRSVLGRRAFVQGVVRRVPDRVATAKMIFPNPIRLLANFRTLYGDGTREPR